MKAVIVSHGLITDFSQAEEIIRDNDIVICADGGAEYVLRCGIIPDILVGDLDSLKDETYKRLENTKCKVLRYPKEKDFTDTQLAVDYAVEAGASEITMLGSIGDRLDHSLANIFLLINLIKKNIKACIINEKNIINIISSTIKLRGNIGDLLSLIPIGGDAFGVYTDGLKYKLSGANIVSGDPIGISNVFSKEEVEISIESGLLLVISSKD